MSIRHKWSDQLQVGQDYTRPPSVVKAWRDRPKRGVAPKLLATIYRAEGRHEEAVLAAQAAVDFSRGEDAVSNHLLAQSLATLERWPEAVEARLMTIDAGEGGHWMQWYWLAEAYAAVGDSAQAVMALDTARTREVPEVGVRQIDSLQTLYGGR